MITAKEARKNVANSYNIIFQEMMDSINDNIIKTSNGGEYDCLVHLPCDNNIADNIKNKLKELGYRITEDVGVIRDKPIIKVSW